MEDEVEVVPDQPPKVKVWSKQNALVLISLCYANFTLGTCYSLPAPFFPQEAENKGASPTVYGLVFGAFQVVSLVISPILGRLMPYLVPSFVLVTGMFVAGTSSILFGILEFCPAGIDYISLSFCVRIVEAIGVSAYVTVCFGMTPVIFPDNVATVLAITETLFGFGLIAGPTVGGALYQIGGYYLPFVVMGGCLMFGTILTAIAFSGRENPPQEKTGSVWKMLSSSGMILDSVLFAMGAVCIGFNDATLEPHLRQFNLQPAVLGAVFIIVGGTYALASPVYGVLIDKGVNSHLLSSLGCALLCVSFLIIGPVPFLPFKTSFPVIIVSLALQGLGIGAKSLSVFTHGMKDVLSRGFPDNVSTYALYSGLMMAFNSLGAFAGPSLGGLLLDHVGYEKGTIVIVAAEGLLLIYVIVYMIMESTAKKKDEQPTIVRTEQPEINTEAGEKTPLLGNSSEAVT